MSVRIPPAAWLLAQATLASTHPSLCDKATSLSCKHIDDLADEERKKFKQFIVGPGLDGSISLHNGFLPAYPLQNSLPPDFQAYEDIIAQLPTLLRFNQARDAIATLPDAAFQDLLPCYLNRASIILSSLAHAFYANYRIGKKIDAAVLPEALQRACNIVATRMQRELGAARVASDDIFNNVRWQRNKTLPNAPLPLAVQYFNIPEEHLSSGLQGRMEAEFAPCFEWMCNAQRAVASQDASMFIDALSCISAQLVRCGKIMALMSPLDFDISIWGRTYPEMGRPINESEPGNSGVDAPLFHALDAFIGRNRQKPGELEAQQAKRALAFPVTFRVLLHALRDPRYSIQAFVAKSNTQAITHALDVLIQTYAWLLHMHRRKAVGAIAIVLAGGRPSTAGGAAFNHAQTMPIDEMINQQMLVGILDRTRGHATDINVCITAKDTTTTQHVLTMTLQCQTPTPLRAGDHVHIYTDGNATPRTYSVAESLGSSITLNIALHQQPGLSVRYLQSRKIHDNIRLRLSFVPLFHAPADQTLPLILIAQGVGVGPFYGFLKERLEAVQQGHAVGGIVLCIAAKSMHHVPYLNDFITLTKQLPLMMYVVLKEGISCMIQQGVCTPLPDNTTLEHALNTDTASHHIIQAMLTGGHCFVCGSVGFGMDMRCLLEGMIKPYAHATEAAGALTRRYHEDLFSQNHSEHPWPEISEEELAQHNQADDLWSSFHGEVYNLTAYARMHPGGHKVLMAIAGTTGDRRFVQIHGDSQQIMARMQPYKIGTLKQSPVSYKQLYAIIHHLVVAQNTLRNNTTFLGGQDVPFYVIADTLLTWIELDIPKIVGQLPQTETLQATIRQLALNLAIFKDKKYAQIKNSSHESSILKQQASLTLQAMRMLEIIKLEILDCLNNIRPERLVALLLKITDTMTAMMTTLSDDVKKYHAPISA